MNIDDFNNKYIIPYSQLYSIFIPKIGYIVWRFSSGNNAELLHIKVFSPGNQYGQKLIGFMLNELRDNPPYNSVFGFSLNSNDQAIKFYTNCGFKIVKNLDFPYRDDKSFVFWSLFSDLLINNEFKEITGINYKEYLIIS